MCVLRWWWPRRRWIRRLRWSRPWRRRSSPRVHRSGRENYNGKSHNRIHDQDSVPRFLRVVRLFPAPGPWSSLAPIGIKRLSSSIELDAQNVEPHQTTIKRKRHHTWKSCACLIPVSNAVVMNRQKQLRNGEGFWLFRTTSRLKNEIHRGSQRTAGSAGLRKRCVTERPTVSLHLDELPN